VDLVIIRGEKMSICFTAHARNSDVKVGRATLGRNIEGSVTNV
jgi:hypothetical protein